VTLVKTEDTKDVKSQVKHEESDSKPARIKQEIKAEAPMNPNSAIHMGGGQVDVKPSLPQLSTPSGPLMTTREGLSPPLKQEQGKSQGLTTPAQLYFLYSLKILEKAIHLNALPVKVEDASVKEGATF
jgi:hypothetical protein